MVEDSGLVVVKCKHHLVTRFLIGDILLLVAYLWGLYIFRSKSPEHLATLMETVSFVCCCCLQDVVIIVDKTCRSSNC